RALTTSPSPWSFSSATQTSPVLDVLAVDQQTQARALTDGVLPAPAVRRDSGLPWLLLARFGVLVAGFGLWLRRRVPAPAVVAAGVEDVVPADAEAEDAALDEAEAEAADVLLREAEATGVAPAEEEAAAGAPAEATAEVAAPETAATEAETGAAAPEAPVATVPVEAPEELMDQSSAGPREDHLEPRDGDRDPIAAAWADEEDGEDAPDDIAAFLAGGARPRELRVEHVDEDDEPA